MLSLRPPTTLATTSVRRTAAYIPRPLLTRHTHATAPRPAASSKPASQPVPSASTGLSSLLLPSFAPRGASASSSKARSYNRRHLATPAAMPESTSNGAAVPMNGAAAVETKMPRIPDITEEVGGKVNVEKLRKTARDFRSDTFTMPSDAQLLYALRATRGDDVYHEDPTTEALETRIAKMAGKEAALFGASGTMTNQLAIRTHMKQPPHSVITDHRAHVHMMEAGGIAMFTQATTHGLVPGNGLHLTAEDIAPALQLGNNVHIAPTKLICLENTLSGIIFPQHEVERIGELARKHDIGMHLDGARAWNVAAAEIERRGLNPSKEADLTTALSHILAPFDSASLCLSKGIGAPIGSAIVGTKEFIDRCRWFRKAFGGGWRQSGSMAAAADYALTHHFPRLQGTHALARKLADGLEDAGCDIVAPVDTNMVFFDPTPAGLSIDQIATSLGQLAEPIKLNANRCVIHHQTAPEAVDDFVAEVKRLAAAVPVESKPQPTAQKIGEKDGKFRVNTLGY